MNVLFVSSEMYPLVKVGGLGDVVGSLPKALRKMGVDARVLIPRYRFIEDHVEMIAEHTFEFGDVRIYGMEIDGVPVYLAEVDDLFRDEVYVRGDWKRWAIFSKIAANLPHLIDFTPSVLHIHDWMTSLTAAYARGGPWKIVLTIHNLRHQGVFPRSIFPQLGLDASLLNAFLLDDKINFLKGAIILSDIITTVSPTYAKEILTPEYGEGLEKVLMQRRGDIYGILNGLDYDVWNPNTDPFIFQNYGVETVDKKKLNKEILCENLGCNSNLPLFGFVARLVEQKGVDILIDAMREFDNANFLILGTGRDRYEDALRKLATKKKNVKAIITYDEKLAHQIYAASDFFLMPSRFEPCGLGQMIAMRYGTIPVVRETGGLKDSVKDIEEEGWGITFREYSSKSLINAINRAINLYGGEKMKEISLKAMSLDFSWNRSAREYAELYKRLIL